MCCLTLHDIELCESKICCQGNGNNTSGCDSPCMTRTVLRNIVVVVGILYLIISLLPVSYYILHAIIPKILLQNPNDLQDLQQLSSLSVGIIIALLVNVFLNLAFLIGVDAKLARTPFLFTWMGISIGCVVLHGIGLIWLTYTGLGKAASTFLEKQKSETKIQGDQYFLHLR